MEASYTKLHSFFSCEYAYKLRYIDRIPIKENSASIYGSAVHKAIKIGYDNKLPREDWAKVFKQEWMSLTSTKDIIFFGENDFLNKFKSGQVLVTNYYDTFVKKSKPPLETELFFNRERGVLLGKHLLVGVIDIIDSKNRIIDLKTGKKPSQNGLDLDLQFTVYSYVYRQLYKKEENGLILRHLGTMKDMPTTRTEKDFLILLEEVDKIERRLNSKSGIFIRNLDRGCADCYFLKECLGKERSISRF